MMPSYSERTISATSPLHESGGAAPTPIVIAAVISATTIVQDNETVQAAAEEIPSSEELSAHISDIPEGNNIVESIPIDENHVVDTDFGTGVTHVEHVEVTASGDPV